MIRDQFDTLTVAKLREFVELGQEENLHLDFKLVADSKLSSRDDRKNLAAALSGFANSGGGLIVWGVDARKNTDGVDCTVELKPIDGVNHLVSRLNELTGESVDPTVHGVLHRKVAEGSIAFAVSYIPESDTGPHMARLGENRYFKRVGDSFYQMEHYDIADMFGKRRRPRLVLTYQVTGWNSGAKVILGIKNTGRGTANAPFFAFTCSGDLSKSFYGLDGNKNEGLPVLPTSHDGLQWSFSEGMDVALHPGMERQVTLLTRERSQSLQPEIDQTIDFALACQDQPLERGTLVIPLSELVT